MTQHNNGDDGFISPQQSLQVYRAMQAGLSRRQALKMLGVAGIVAAGSGLLPGLSRGWAAQAQPEPKRGGRIRMAAHSSSSSESLDPARGSDRLRARLHLLQRSDPL